MKLKKVKVTECNNGEIVASDVINYNGIILVTKDTVLNEYIKEKLINLGIIHIFIYEVIDDNNKDSVSYTNFKSNYTDTVKKTKNILLNLTAGKPLDYQEFSNVSMQIYKTMNESSNIIKCLSEIRDADEYTYNHCVNVAFYSMLVARWLKLSEHEIVKAVQAGLLHDIGKTKIPNEVLCKPNVLTKEEFEIIKNHTILGYEIIEKMDDIHNDIKDVTLYHHERLDGTGYPLVNYSDKVNLYTRIVSITDVFDAMTSERVYRKRLTPFDAIEMFQTEGVSMFDTSILKVFMDNLAAYLTGASVVLNNNKKGEIAYIPLQNITSPIVKISNEYVDLSRESNIKILSML